MQLGFIVERLKMRQRHPCAAAPAAIEHVVLWAMQLHSLAKELKHSNVFPCVTASARYRGSGEPASRRGSPVSRKAAFLQIGKAATLLLTEPLRLRHLPYPRFTRGRGGHCYAPTAHNRIFASITNLSTINSQL